MIGLTSPAVRTAIAARLHQHLRTMAQIVGVRVTEQLELVISAEVQACAAVAVSAATLTSVGVAELPTIIHASFQRQTSPKSLNLRLCKMRARIAGAHVTGQQVLVTSAEPKDCAAGKVSAEILKSVGAAGRPTTTHASFPQMKQSQKSQCCRTRAKIVGALVTGQPVRATIVAQRVLVAARDLEVTQQSVGVAEGLTSTPASFQRKRRACRTKAKIVGTLVTGQPEFAITVAQKVSVVVKVSPATLNNAEGGELQISTRALCLLRPRRRSKRAAQLTSLWLMDAKITTPKFLVKSSTSQRVAQLQ